MDRSAEHRGELRFEGVFPVVSTPFHDDGRCDAAALERLIDYVTRAGADGAVYPAIASEFATLDLDERRAMVDVALAACRQRGLPMIIGVSAAAPELSAGLATQAAEGGAAAIMLMAPRSVGDSVVALETFFSTVTRAAPDLPIVMQNAPPPLGSSLPVDIVRAVVSRVPAIRYVKEENVPCGQRISSLLQDAPPSLLGAMGGAGGRFVLDEYARGACGSMPACELVEVHVSIWRAVKAGDNRRARDLFTRILPLLNMGGVFRQEVVKRVLKHRGLIASARLRDNSTPLDRYDEAEIQAIIADLGDLMTVQPQRQPMVAQ
jgi:4-hydroxy-tetrahydrodipicolinate synthase